MHKLYLHVPLLLLTFPIHQPAFAHSDGLNAQGCHAGSRPYHCHNSATPAPKTESRALKSFSDKNCSDFTSWQKAQEFFEAAGQHDPHRLDADNDGIACEGLRN